MRHEQDKRRERREGRRERRERKHNGGPVRKAVMEARADAQRALVGTWSIPDVQTLRTLKEAESAPHVLDTAEGRAVLLISVSIADGRPRHGAMMSADHVGSLEAEIPRECPDCGHDRARLTLSRHHNIAGCHAVVCTRCDHEHEAESWG